MIGQNEICPRCSCSMHNAFYFSEDHVCITLEDSEAMFAGFEKLLSKWYPFSSYMADRRLDL
jgi:hypothetical protein